jgi:outer membrane receptor protein involved in Fe transport
VMSYALQRAENVETGASLVNSPGQMAKMRLSLPGPSAGSSLALELLSMSSRQTIAGNRLAPSTTANITVLAPIRHGVELVGTIRNLFDVQYADPASESNRQDSIPQDGRTLRIGLRWTLGK